ncbi:DUF945 family protein [Halomonas huangheensis]|uniref:DUF945 domain-containing protein n=1 Tax=Halomonas huangheensis TaxID=1178482 RepID=W1N3Q8_9GAMM|nr:DUF945 family protein [Halomonas huangheensis]ALM51664.1 hypothetical protein AR456_04720 [Halomonas huangheensis]ERL50153.1 hypothetical protein BJB45_03235 [Halomonas huangheensis]
MRKERWIVPVVVVVALAWAVAQYLASVLFERELARALADLQARGDLQVSRTEVERGWLNSSGVIHLSPLLGHSWHLVMPYEARHGVIDTSIVGDLNIHVGEDDRLLFGEALASAPPYWEAHYRTLGGSLSGELKLAPFVISQSPLNDEPRSLSFGGGLVNFSGIYGDWRVQLQMEPWQLRDGNDAVLEIGPSRLESRYAYTSGALHFSQQDRLTIDALSLRHPLASIDGTNFVVQTHTVLDDSELRVQSQLDVGEIYSGEQLLLDGVLSLEVSRINADALRELLALLQRRATEGVPSDQREELDRALANLLQDSPRLDIAGIDLESPMLGLSVKGDGTLILDSRRLDELSPLELQDPDMRKRFIARLDGDFEWAEVPAMVALWLGQPLGTDTVTIDVVKGQLWINGRPLPPVLKQRLPLSGTN